MLEEMDTLFGGSNHIEKGGAQMLEKGDQEGDNVGHTESLEPTETKVPTPVTTLPVDKV